MGIVLACRKGLQRGCTAKQSGAMQGIVKTRQGALKIKRLDQGACNAVQALIDGCKAVQGTAKQLQIVTKDIE